LDDPPERFFVIASEAKQSHFACVFSAEIASARFARLAMTAGRAAPDFDSLHPGYDTLHASQ
jgi:hypothetical protein